MITVVNTSNQGAYRDLFIDASNLLLGYESIRVYDKDLQEYFIKTNTDEFSFKAVTITSQGAFEDALKEGDLFKKAHYDDGQEVDPIELGFISSTPGPVVEGDVTTFNTLGITTLEEYFSWLYKIKEIGEDYILKYTTLPLDEPHFEINANTRAITIPTDFKKNGIAVQGDDLAEVVYFKVDRYFDAVDLNSCEIYVQWELPKAKTKGVSPVSIKDIASEPGKLIFGWPISRDVTKEAGNLKFSVQFYQLSSGSEEAKVNYSFNTLTATVAIQNSIGLDISDKDSYYEDDIGTRLNDRIQPSVIVGGAQADEPKFYADKDFSAAVYDMEYNQETGEYEVYNLQAQAYASDAGGISYQWWKIPLSEDNEESTNAKYNITSSASEVYNVVDVDDLQAGRVYYIRTGEEDTEYRYERYTSPIPVTDEATRKKVFCEKVTQYGVNEAGCYYVIAENRITNNASTKSSKTAKFPRPGAAVIEKFEASDSGILDENENCTLAVTAKNTAPEVLTYKWYRHPAIKANMIDDPGVEKFVEISDATGSEYVATEPGHYKVEVVNNRNNMSRSTESSYLRITGPVEAPVILENNNLIFTPKSIDYDAGICPQVALDASVNSDRYEVEWHVFEDNNDSIVTTEQLPNTDGELISRFDPTNPDYLEIITGKDGEPNIYASYYAIVTNYWNGQDASTEKPEQSKMFIVRPSEAEAEAQAASAPVTLDLDSKLPFEED